MIPDRIMARLSGAGRYVAVHLFGHWAGRGKARELKRQYEYFFEACPLVAADLARKLRAFDTTFCPDNPHVTAAWSAQRDVWEHMRKMAQLSETDLLELERETSYDGHPQFGHSGHGDDDDGLGF